MFRSARASKDSHREATAPLKPAGSNGHLPETSAEDLAAKESLQRTRRLKLRIRTLESEVGLLRARLTELERKVDAR